MKDDVLALLSSPSPICNQNPSQQKSFQPTNNLLAPSLSSFSSEIYYQEQQQQQQKSQNPNSSSSFGDFDLKIRELEEQARRFKIQDGELVSNNNQQGHNQPIGKYKAVCFSNNDSTQENSDSSRDQQSSSHRSNTSLGLQVQTKCYTPNSFRLGDIKNEENYLEQIRQKLDMQLKETEHLKQEMARSKQPFINQNTETAENFYRATACMPSPGNFSGNNGYVDELIDLRMKLKESYSINEELKYTFRKNLTELQNTLGECVQDKDKLMINKDHRIRDLEDECQIVRNDLKNCQKILEENPSIGLVNNKIHNYEDLSSKLRQLLLNEEKKREKSYFVNGFAQHVQNNQGDQELTCKLLYKAMVNCLEDYQGEIKHSRMIMKELQASWENKEEGLQHRETALNNEFNKKYETIKEEYDRISRSKSEEIIEARTQQDELTAQLNKERENHRKKLDAKDLESKSLQVNIDSCKNDLIFSQKEFKQMKSRFENLKSKEKENLLNYEKTLKQLEAENDKVNNKYEEISNDFENSKKKIETIKCQLTKYEQLIDSLNEQIVLYKREVKENEINHNQICQNYDSERDANVKLNNKCQQLENILQEAHQSLAKYQNMEKNLSDLQFRGKKLENALSVKSNEYDKLKKETSQNDITINTQNKELNELRELKKTLETTLKQCQNELTDVKIKFQNSTVFIQHSCKANSLLKEEKDSLEKILQDNAFKLKNLKNDYDNIYEKYVIIENECNNMQFENDMANKKMDEMKNLNEIIANEKNEANKETNQVKSELSNLKENNKTLSRKLNTNLSEKDSQINQLQQTLSLYEKEINLLKQSETLHKSQEDSKVMEVANTVQLKLSQKNNKIDALKSKNQNLENNIETLTKEKKIIQEEKSKLENIYNTLLTKNDSQNQEIKKIESEFIELRQKILSYELAIDKAAVNFSNSEKRNSLLTENLNKFKKLISTIVYSNEDQTTSNSPLKNLQKQQTPTEHKNPTSKSTENVFTESLASFIISKLKDNLNNKPTPNNENQQNNGNDSNEVNILNFFNKLQFKEGLQEQKKTIQTSSTNSIGKQQQINQILESSVDIDRSSLILNDISHVSCQESNKELCNRIETKLSHLNQIGLNLKKENNEAGTLLLNNG